MPSTDDWFLHPDGYAEIRRIRASEPAAVAAAHAARTRRPLLGDDGRLFLIAADHPARGALGIGGDPMAMADRIRMLDRLALALSRPGVDGVLGTPDVIDDLALLGVLDGKVAAGSMNRGGLRGAVFELDDRYTAYDVPAIVRDRLDFAKCLLRIDLRDPATVVTLEATAAAVSAAAAAEVPIMLEPFMSRTRGGVVENDLTADAVITAVGIAAALGTSSAYSWMKLPVVPDMERVMAATTLPTLLLGGDRADDPDAAYSSWEHALSLPGVRGLVVGRNLLAPPGGDVAAAVDQAARMVRPAIADARR
ncbi:deoxyribose-phosphate aldolase [Agromyces intestinalis]|uniref:Deoxyribose-phosphate aldolase n=1 Tax=Agromyces intestinalis TaxID=2592652 RepID=A0A5C1YFD6_9MICO|nr:deoxyribose-phosphate aldolase [Agromyces intestinalis]QEO14388.1 deoxyribose-phosphate aldolase [Agromyces intestinalis]